MGFHERINYYSLIAMKPLRDFVRSQMILAALISEYYQLS